MTLQLTLTALENIPLIQRNDDLVPIILRGLEHANLKLTDGDVLVVAQKVVSKSEGRMVRLADVTPTAEALELAKQSGKDARFCEVLLWDTRQIIRVRPGLIIVETRDGWVCANAGIDRSNTGPPEEGWVLRLPEDADRSARELRARLHSQTGADVGIIINDTHGRPWRNGAVGVAIGAAGVPALEDMRGRLDLFGYEFQSTVIALADQVASAASLLQGQVDEGLPIVHARGVPFSKHEGSASEIPRSQDLNLFR